ncbi:NUDIX domain-containing protein [Akkermansia sp. N21116]|uniref:NUDIX hydrolase n=1 Tax=Akkermansia sp. N21116 TaxID=3040764 RepID=UPI00244E9582|nr:NUDIX domain-containing protein [Akkermansia sp. N21116]WPX41390.1 NUDIX domain-containing protein [Akkermansia sp. N21116]
MDTAHLSSLLTGYSSPFPEESIARLRMLSLLEKGKDAWNRVHYEPGHFTASAYVLNPVDWRVAMVFHRHLKRWLQPGGHAEDSDATIEASARRELLEETGLDPRGKWELLDLDIHVIPARPGQPAHEHFDLRFLCLPSQEILPELCAADDAEAACWQPMELLRKSDEVGMRRIYVKLAEFIGSIH